MIQPGCRARFALFLPLVLWWAGCGTAPVSRLKTAAASIVSRGPVEQPASITVADTKTTIPLPAGTVVSFSPADPIPSEGLKFSLPVASSATVEHTSTTTTAAKNFSPPAPPTPAQEAEGSGVRVFYYLAAACALAALVCIYAQHYKAAGILVCGAAGIPFLIHLGQTAAASHLATAVICIAGALVAAWEIFEHRDAIYSALEEAREKGEVVFTQAKTESAAELAKLRQDYAAAAAELTALKARV